MKPGALKIIFKIKLAPEVFYSQLLQKVHPTVCLPLSSVEMLWWETNQNKEANAAQNQSGLRTTAGEPKLVMREQLLQSCSSLCDKLQQLRLVLLCFFFLFRRFFNDSIIQFRQLKSSRSDFPINQSRLHIAHWGKTDSSVWLHSPEPLDQEAAAVDTSAQLFVQPVIYFLCRLNWFPLTLFQYSACWKKNKMEKKPNAISCLRFSLFSKCQQSKCLWAPSMGSNGQNAKV